MHWSNVSINLATSCGSVMGPVSLSLMRFEKARASILVYRQIWGWGLWDRGRKNVELGLYRGVGRRYSGRAYGNCSGRIYSLWLR